MTISVKDVEHVAKLARLELSENEKELYSQQMGKIIAYFDQLNAVNTDGIEPMSHALPVKNVLREDVVVNPPGRDVLLAGAPAVENGYFKVPKIGD
jgi:aspartyl-tRNA(Asn)/glutamyl-tRNA(Gln) amidotransferase subunit C